jgi:hypothetical protein
MGEFHDAVTTLLDAFTSAIGVIKVQRGKRKTARIAIDSERKEAESYLSRSLKRSRRDVKHAYERDAKALGDGFRNGDSMSCCKMGENGKHELTRNQMKHDLDLLLSFFASMLAS